MHNKRPQTDVLHNTETPGLKRFVNESSFLLKWWILWSINGRLPVSPVYMDVNHFMTVQRRFFM